VKKSFWRKARARYCRIWGGGGRWKRLRNTVIAFLIVSTVHAGEPARVECCARRDWVYTWSTVRTCTKVQFKSKLHTVKPNRPQHDSRPCYRPAVFFIHRRLIALAFPWGKVPF
jgi:hypothetical protein